MNKLSIWNPLRELEEFSNRMGSLLGKPSTSKENGGDEAMMLTDWSPRVDVSEDDSEFLIKAELPEVKKDNVTVTVEDGSLKIFGERKLEKEKKGKKYHRIETSYGSFSRRFALPDGVDASKVKAAFSDGVLNVRLPKDKSSKPKSVNVAIG